MIKKTRYKNIVNHEVLECDNIDKVQIINGIEYVNVNRPGSNHQVLIRKDVLVLVK